MHVPTTEGAVVIPLLPMLVSRGVPLWALKLGGCLLLAVALLLGYLTWAGHQQGIGEARAEARYTAAIAEQQRQAAEVLARETAKVRAVERELLKIKNAREVDDAKNSKQVAALTARLHDLAGPAGRLRDPKAPAGHGPGGGSGGGDPAAPGDCPDHGAEAPGLLSAELTGLLRRLAGEADEINNAYASCRAWAQAIEESAP